MILYAENVTRQYKLRGQFFSAVNNLSLQVAAGELIALIGSSGSGKTTLLTMLAGLLTPTSGQIKLKNTVINQLRDWERCQFRNRHIGFIPQGQSLLTNLTIFDNIRLAHDLLPRDDDISGRINYLLDCLGIAELSQRLPAELSGGEMRRVAVARALINKPDLLLADEPTSDLDTDNGKIVMNMFTAARDRGTTIIYSTHEKEAANYATRILTMEKGCWKMS